MDKQGRLKLSILIRARPLDLTRIRVIMLEAIDMELRTELAESRKPGPAECAIASLPANDSFWACGSCS
jgi:hypothetical protein